MALSFTEKCGLLVRDPGYREDYLRGLKPGCGGLIGCFSNYIPEEVVCALGLHPFRIIGRLRWDGMSEKASLLPRQACAFVHDVAAAARAGAFAYADRVVFPRSCDALDCLLASWPDALDCPAAELLSHPVNDDEAAVDYFAAELRRFADRLAGPFGLALKPEALRAAVEKYNLTRALLARLGAPGVLRTSQLIELVTAALIMRRDEFNTGLAEFAELKTREAAPSFGGPRVMLLGPLLDDAGLVGRIETFGADIVCDSVTNGRRYFAAGQIGLEGDLFRNLAAGYLAAQASPTAHSDASAPAAVLARIAASGARAAIFIVQRSCDPHLMQYLTLAPMLKRAGIRHILLETEHVRPAPDERTLFRLESFIETIGEN